MAGGGRQSIIAWVVVCRGSVIKQKQDAADGGQVWECRLRV